MEVIFIRKTEGRVVPGPILLKGNFLLFRPFRDNSVPRPFRSFILCILLSEVTSPEYLTSRGRTLTYSIQFIQIMYVTRTNVDVKLIQTIEGKFIQTAYVTRTNGNGKHIQTIQRKFI